MNRENKLAIIIGFSLVLVVAVLISDHFSRARTAEISSDIRPGTAEDFGVGTVGLTKPIGGPEAIPAHTGPLGAMANSRTQTVSDVTPAIPVHTPEEFTMQNSRLAPPPGLEESFEVSEDVEITDPVGGDGAFPAKPVSTGVMKTHEVKEGDKLFRIAATHYGDGTLWQALADYNKARVPTPSALRVGVTLQIPPRDVLLGEAVLAPAGSKPKTTPGAERTGGRPRTAPVTPPPAPANTPKSNKPPVERSIAKATPTATYKIARGDDLGKIAQKMLGSSRRARELYQLNRDVLEDEHTLVPGKVIKLPAR